jgi:histidine triad (HIT) family protein
MTVRNHLIAQSPNHAVEGCVFCRIVAGELPSAKLYEDAHCLVIMDIRPILRGHALVLPKVHCEGLLDAPPGIFEPMLEAARRCAAAIVKATGAEAFNIFQANGAVAGQTVFHLHLHILPRRRGDGFADTPLRELERQAMEERFEELAALADHIREQLNHG